MPAAASQALQVVFPNKSLAAFFDQSPYGVIVTDAEGIIIYYNQSQARIDSLEPAEVLGKKLIRVYGPQPEPALIATCLKTRQPVLDFVGLYRTFKGKIINSSHTVFPIMDGKRLVGALCLIVEMKKLVSANKVSTLKSRPKVANEVSFDTLVGQNLQFQRAVELGRMTALSPSPVMLAAETGCGKEMFARSIHEASERAARPFVAVNCAAIPGQLLEGTLFGTVKGAFTGAVDRSGLFEEANGGTLFLDELDSMPLELQPKLLRVLQEKNVRRVGSDKDTNFDLKIISSLSGDTESILAGRRVRPDLFYRLGVVIISLPPLRERLDDLPLLVNYFLMKHNFTLGRKVGQADPEVLSAFLSYHWPGNIRELEHVIEGAMNLVGNEEVLTKLMLPEHFQVERNMPFYQPAPLANPRSLMEVPASMNVETARPDFGHIGGQPDAAPLTLKEAEKRAIIQALIFTRGNVSSAAKVLGLSRQLLTHKIKAHGLNRRHYVL